MKDKANSQISVYRLSIEKINKKIAKEAAKKNQKVQDFKNYDEVIKYLIQNSSHKYTDLKLKDFVNELDFDLKVYYSKISLPASWVKFLKPIVAESEKAFFDDENQHKSFVGFIYDKEDIFVFTGGLGSHVVKDFIDEDFGISVLVRLLPKDQMSLRRAVNKTLTGTELSSDRFFKSTHKISNEDTYGKIFKSIYSSIPKEVLWDKLGLPKKAKDRASSVVAKSFFQIGRSISYKELLTIIQKIKGILKQDALFELNKIKKISGRGIGEKDLLVDLNKRLIIDIFKAAKENKLNRYDLLHKDLDKFVSATSFHIKKNTKVFEPIEGIASFSLERVFHEVSNDKYFIAKANEIDLDAINFDNLDFVQDLTTIECLQSLLELYKIQACDAEGQVLTIGSVIDYIQAEVDHEGQVFFLLEEEWYLAKDGFIDDINIGCSELIEQLKVDDLLPEKWDYEKDDEDSYISKYFDDKYADFVLPMHKALHDQMELCDILIKKNRSLYFVHIKTGFDGSVRDLISQVHLSAKVFISERSKHVSWEKNDLIEGYHQALLNSELTGSVYADKFTTKYNGFKKASFVNYFKKDIDNFYFVFAVVDSAKTERLLPDKIKNFKSSIAKMSLINLEKDIAVISTRSSSLKFVQILRK